MLPLIHVSSINTEKAGFMTYTAASHQMAIALAAIFISLLK